MLNTVISDGLTFDDILLLPSYSAILPNEANVVTSLTSTIDLKIPLISAAMDTVTEAKLAIIMAQEGGIGIIHRNMSIAEQVDQVTQIKKMESDIVRNPITINSNASIKTAIAIAKTNNISGMPVIESFCDNQNKLVGIITMRDMKFIENTEACVSEYMTKKENLITANENASKAELIELFAKNKVEKILIVNKDFELLGLITAKDIEKANTKQCANKDKDGRLRVGAAVGVGNDAMLRAEALINANVDVITIDTAHGHSKKVIDFIKELRKNFDNVQIVAGNVATSDGAIALADAGANAIKVGIGPGSICTTRIVTGVGVPQFSAILQAAVGLKNYNVKIIADGGIRYAGDIAKAIAAGAHAVMIGSLFAGTDEAPGELEFYDGRAYKSYRGMGSLGAMMRGSSDRYFQNENSSNKLIPEGVEAKIPYKGKASLIIKQLVGGLRASLGYTGCENIESLRQYNKFCKITGAGMRESHVHDVAVFGEKNKYTDDN